MMRSLLTGVMTATLTGTMMSAGLAGCSGKKSSGGGKSDTPVAENTDPAAAETPPPAHQVLELRFRGFELPWKPEHGDDATTNTYGVYGLFIQPLVDDFAIPEDKRAELADIEWKAQAWYRGSDGKAAKAGSVDAKAEKLLAGLCRDIVVSGDNEFTGPADINPKLSLAAEVIWLGWRSHISAADRKALGELLLAKELTVICGVEVSLKWAGAASSKPAFFRLDPVAWTDETKTHPSDLYVGTADYSTAIKEPLMLIMRNDKKTDLPDATWTAVAPQGEPSFTRKIPAINGAEVTVTFDQDSGSDGCVMHLTDVVRVTNPDETQTVGAAVNTVAGVSAELTAVSLTAAADGTAGAVCESLQPDADSDTKAFLTSLTCAQVGQIEAGGGCSVVVELTNKADPTNTQRIIAGLSGIRSETKDLTEAVGADSVMPEVAENPLRGATPAVSLVGFDGSGGAETGELRRSTLARSVDLWMHASMHSFTEFFDGHIVKIEYKEYNPACADDPDPDCDPCKNAGAYAYFGSDNFVWCPGGAMNGDFLQAEEIPGGHTYRAMTALHETLHTHSKPHDIDDAGIEACSKNGTAYAAVIAYDIQQCSEEFCYGFRKSARDDFRQELDYSLQDDARRFEGQCDLWAKALGVSFTP